MPPATRNPLQSSASEPKNFHAVHARMCTSWGIIGSRRPLKGQLVLQALPPVTMPRYFHGVVSRFSAGRRSLSLGDRQAVTSFLQRSDISFQGIQQFLGGEGVTNVGDRHKLVAKVGELLDPKRVLPVGHAALLPPAVQSAREATRRAQKLQDLGFSATGAQQFVGGLPMNGADDRQILPQIVIAALRSALTAHGGGYNQMTLDDTRGKEK